MAQIPTGRIHLLEIAQMENGQKGHCVWSHFARLCPLHLDENHNIYHVAAPGTPVVHHGAERPVRTMVPLQKRLHYHPQEHAWSKIHIYCAISTQGNASNLLPSEERAQSAFGVHARFACRALGWSFHIYDVESKRRAASTCRITNYRENKFTRMHFMCLSKKTFC